MSRDDECARYFQSFLEARFRDVSVDPEQPDWFENSLPPVSRTAKGYSSRANATIVRFFVPRLCAGLKRPASASVKPACSNPCREPGIGSLRRLVDQLQLPGPIRRLDRDASLSSAIAQQGFAVIRNSTASP